MLYRNLKKYGLLLALIGVVCASASAQVPTPKPPAPPPDTLAVEPSARQSPQIVTVVHRLNGIKALALLGRSGQAVTMVDDDVVTAPDAVTSITAGFVLGDGQNIVARLPQAEAEFEALPSAFSTSFNFQFPSASAAPPAPVAPRAPTAAVSSRATMRAESSGLIVVQSNGKQYAAKYVGLDGVSGLSLLKISGLKVPAGRDTDEDQLAVGQPVRLFAPMQIAKEARSAQATVALRVGEIEGTITEITRTSTGKIARLIVRALNPASNITPAVVGGVALNEAGEVVGIVEASNAGSARLIPVTAVRRAAERVLARQASVPRPWLGIKGEPVERTSLDKFYLSGWTAPEAAALKEQNQGILLTSVAPGTPAARANLRPGDVIVRVNNFEVKNGEDFSYVLNEAGGGATVNFTVFRAQTPKPSTMFTPVRPPVPPTPMQPMPPGVWSPEAFKPFDISVKLGESLNPARTMRLAEEYVSSFSMLNPLPQIARGIETAKLSQKAATHLGARGGLLVLYVDSESLAAHAGLRVFDVIETVEGKALGQVSFFDAIPKGDPQRLTLGIVREGKRREVTIQKDAKQ